MAEVLQLKVTDLPEEILSNIFTNINTSELLNSVSLVNKQFNEIITSNHHLWTCIRAENDVYEWNERKFIDLLSKLKYCKTLDIGGIFTELPSFALDNIFIASIGAIRPKHLTHLDISNLKISTLGFLIHTPSIKTLIISCCKQLIDCDLFSVQQLNQLLTFHCGFTKIKDETIVNVVNKLNQIKHLDCVGIPFTPAAIAEVLNIQSLKSVSLSASGDFTSDELDHIIAANKNTISIRFF